MARRGTGPQSSHSMLPPPPTTRPALPPPPRRGAVLDDSPRPASASFCTRCAGCHDSGSLSLSLLLRNLPSPPSLSLSLSTSSILKDSFLARPVCLARRTGDLLQFRLEGSCGVRMLARSDVVGHEYAREGFVWWEARGSRRPLPPPWARCHGPAVVMRPTRALHTGAQIA